MVPARRVGDGRGDRGASEEGGQGVPGHLYRQHPRSGAATAGEVSLQLMGCGMRLWRVYGCFDGVCECKTPAWSHACALVCSSTLNVVCDDRRHSCCSASDGVTVAIMPGDGWRHRGRSVRHVLADQLLPISRHRHGVHHRLPHHGHFRGASAKLPVFKEPFLLACLLACLLAPTADLSHVQ